METTMQPTPEDLMRDLAADLVLSEQATPGPWYTVDSVWLPPGCGTYVVAGHPDPHIGKAVLDHIEIYEWDADEGHPGYSQSDADLAFAAAARTGWPAAIRRAMTAEAKVMALEAELARCQADGGRLRALCRSLETARDERDAFERDLRQIGRTLGCDHLKDGLARCVDETIERLVDDLAACRLVCRGLADRVAAQAELLSRRAEGEHGR